MKVSISSIQDFLSCRRMYYYKRIKKYERDSFSIPHLVGRVVHTGIYHLFRKSKDYIGEAVKFFKEEKKHVIEKFTLSSEDEQDLNEIEVVVRGMLDAYKKRYAVMLRDVKLVSNEQEGILDIDGDEFIYKIDNIVRIREKKVLHELKTSKYITHDYVRSIRTNFQTAAYFYAYNYGEKDPIKEVMYDIIRKPSIRQKKNESYGAFLKRLGEWYDNTDDGDSKFHVERFEKPLISENDVFCTVGGVLKDLKASKQKEDFYQNFEKCHSYYGERCPYYELCHEGGETKENMVLYTIGRSK